MNTYRAASVLTPDELALETALGATPSGLVDHPTFFRGFVAQPAVVAAGLLAVADVAATRYFDLAALRASVDPVVTASGDRLRFEAFSVCNGVHARLDLLTDGIESGEVAFGTTNVDVNPPLRAGLAGVGRADLLHLTVGPDELRVATLDGTHVERKVDLPDRWVRGFAETPAVGARMRPAFEVTGPEVAPFLFGLPRAAPGPTVAVAPTPRGPRVTVATAPGAVALAGTGRLTAARRIARFARGLAVHGDPAGASGWVFDLPGARLTLMLTAEPYRGFSGEGGLLRDLAGPADDGDAHAVLTHLAWEPVIDPDWLASATGLPRVRVDTALATLAASGKVGFDLAEQAWFHRELPMDVERAHRDNPRLVAARTLVAAGEVVRDGDRWRAGRHWVSGETCTCRWYARYRGGRGPCTHVLAVGLVAA